MSKVLSGTIDANKKTLVLRVCQFFKLHSPHPLSLYGKEQREHFSKHLHLSSTEERMLYSFGTT